MEAQRQSRKEWKEVFVHVTLVHRNQLWIMLNRPVVIRAALCEVMKAGLVFGAGTKSRDNVSTFILPFQPRQEVCTSPSPADHIHSHTMECPGVEFGRILVTAAALASMLRAAGHNTEILGPHSDIELTQVERYMCTHSGLSPPTSPPLPPPPPSVAFLLCLSCVIDCFDIVLSSHVAKSYSTIVWITTSLIHIYCLI